MSYIKPFWAYYGGKFRAALHYPKPTHRTIIEPFAGSAGYSMRYPDHDVVLVERYPVIAGMWRYLISAKASDIMSIPLVDSVHDLPAWVPIEARDLVGFALNSATVSPRVTLSSGAKWLRENGRPMSGWSHDRKCRIAAQVDRIRHWKIIEGNYSCAPDADATWFVDPPYNNKAGGYYVHSSLDYQALAAWCLSRRGQTIVCENEGADWLPFKPFKTLKAGINGKGSNEVVYVKTDKHFELTP